MKNVGNPGINKLASTLQNRMSQTGNRSPILDFGEIQSDYSLVTNQFPIAIPKTDYTVCRKLLGEKQSSITIQGGMHKGHSEGDGGHTHTVTLPGSNGVIPGDRVLVAWIDSDAVVIDVIVPASRL